MEKPSTYIVGTPLYENTQGAYTNHIIVYGNIILGFLTAGFWGVFCWVAWIVHPNTPLLIKVPILVIAILLLERAVWAMRLARSNWAVTDASDAHSFERNSLFLILLITLISESNKQFSNGECEPKPVTGAIVNDGNRLSVEVTKDNTLGFCDFIQNNATSTLMWALCTVPLLLLFGTGWKTLKATHKQYGEEATWIPCAARFFLSTISDIDNFFRKAFLPISEKKDLPISEEIEQLKLIILMLLTLGVAVFLA